MTQQFYSEVSLCSETNKHETTESRPIKQLPLSGQNSGRDRFSRTACGLVVLSSLITCGSNSVRAMKTFETTCNVLPAFSRHWWLSFYTTTPTNILASHQAERHAETYQTAACFIEDEVNL